MKAIEADDLSGAWLGAIEHLVEQPKGKAVNLLVAYRSMNEDVRVRRLLDDFLMSRARKKSGAWHSVNTVANTLFPQSWYQPDRASDPRAHLYECYALAQEVHKRISGEEESYFGRLIDYPAPDGQRVNQLEEQVRRLEGQLKHRGPKSSAYEIGVVTPADLRVQVPGADHMYMGFPCLSHISLTLHGNAIHLTALYRNQGFLRKAYGNYVGLARLARFFARELGVDVGEVACVASHADAEVDAGTLTGLRELVQRSRDIYGQQATLTEIDHVA